MKWIYRLWLFVTKPAEVITWLGSEMTPVNARQAQDRLALCQSCPHKVPGGKASQIAAVTLRHLARMRAKLGCTLKNEDDSFCRGCGCQIALKVWVPYSHIKAYQRTAETEKIRAVKPDCWQL